MFFGVSAFSQFFGVGNKGEEVRNRKRSSDEAINEDSPEKKARIDGEPKEDGVVTVKEDRTSETLNGEKKSVRFDEEVEVCEISRDTSSFQSSQNTSTFRNSLLEDSQENTVLEESVDCPSGSNDKKQVRFDEEVIVNEISRDSTMSSLSTTVQSEDNSTADRLDYSQMNESKKEDDGEMNSTVKRVHFDEEVIVSEISRDSSMASSQDSVVERRVVFSEDVSLYEYSRDESQIGGSQSSIESFHSCTMDNETDNTTMNSTEKRVHSDEEVIVSEISRDSSMASSQDSVVERRVVFSEDVSLYEYSRDESQIGGSQSSIESFHSCTMDNETDKTTGEELNPEDKQVVLPTLSDMDTVITHCAQNSVLESTVDPWKEEDHFSPSLGWINSLLKAIECQKVIYENRTMVQVQQDTLIINIMEKRIERLLRAKNRAEHRAETAENRLAEAEKRAEEAERQAEKVERQLERMKRDLVEKEVELDCTVLMNKEEASHNDSTITMDTDYCDDNPWDTVTPSSSSSLTKTEEKNEDFDVDDFFNIVPETDYNLDEREEGNSTPVQSKKNVSFKNTPEVFLVEKYIGDLQCKGKGKDNKKKGGSNVRKRQQRSTKNSSKRRS